LVLRLFGYGDPERQRLSDYTCTALQLTNFWQDVARDYGIGRIYIPQDTLIRFGASEADIENRDPSPRFKAALAFEVGRARDLFRRGMPLIDRVSGKARIDIALFTAGGIAILDQIRKADYDVLARRPRISKFGKARLFASAWVRSKLGLHPLSRRMRS
jgi:phytoene/squalene synthetase